MIVHLSIAGLLSLLSLIFSYTFIDPNLIFFAHNPLLVSFQRNLFYFGRTHPIINTLFFTSILITWFIWFKKITQQPLKTIITCSLVFSLFSLLVYPAFSYDLFNNIFSAKIVTVYHQDPTQITPLHFANQDNWVRFMHNINAVSPYGPVWIHTSAQVFKLFYSISPTFFSVFFGFKLFNTLLYGLTAWILYLLLKLTHNHPRWLGLFLLNPFIIWEGIFIAHNDMLMVFFTLISFYFLILTTRQKHPLTKTLFFTLTFTTLFLSIQTKYATVILLPLYLIYLARPNFNITPTVTLALFLVPFIRWPWIHSWYFLWSLSFLPLIKNPKLQKFLIIISFAFMLRYLPFILFKTWNLYYIREIFLILSIAITAKYYRISPKQVYNNLKKSNVI